MNAFLTGSHVYGKPTKKSDIDLVVRMDAKELLQLARAIGQDISEAEHYGHGSVSLRFGKLNLIVCVNDTSWSAWDAATKVEEEFGPRSREKTVESFRTIFEGFGVS